MGLNIIRGGTAMRWRHVRTGEMGWSCEVLEYRGHIVGQIDKFPHGVYGTVLGERTGNLGRDRRKARRIVRQRAARDTSGVKRFLNQI